MTDVPPQPEAAPEAAPAAAPEAAPAAEELAAAPEAAPAAEEPRRRDRSTVVVLAVLAAVAVLLVAVGVPVAVSQARQDEQAAVDLTLDAVVVVEDQRTDHTEDDVTYEQVPPTGGPHDPAWLDCGVYDEPVRDENAVHDLEHGTVWVTHDPGLSEDEVEELAAQLPENGILSPHEDLPAPVVVTVWGRQLQLTGADDPRLGLFVDTFGGGTTAPEPFASCAGGLTDPQGDGQDDGATQV